MTITQDMQEAIGQVSDRIRAAKDTDLRNLHGFTQNQIWCELVAMACELT